jgi:translation machinery-associated protein 16
MGSTLQKTRKQISKKRNGVPNALHEKSRDSLRLHKASVRDQRLDRLVAARSKKEQPIGQYIFRLSCKAARLSVYVEFD